MQFLDTPVLTCVHALQQHDPAASCRSAQPHRYYTVSHTFTNGLTNDSTSRALVHGGSLMFRDEGMQVGRERHAALQDPSSWAATAKAVDLTYATAGPGI